MSTTTIPYNVEEALGVVLPAYKFYGDEVTIYYDYAEHRYTRYGNEGVVVIDGVTTVVKIIDKSGALVPWAAKMVVEDFKTRWKEFTPSIAAVGEISFPALEEWLLANIDEAKNAHRDKKEYAANIGSMAHDWLELYIKSMIKFGPDASMPPLPEHPQSRNCINAAISWMEKHKVIWQFTERKIYSRIWDFAGTMDGLAYVSSCDDKKCCPTLFSLRLSLIDWKSSNGLYDEYRLQTAAYEQGHEEEFGVDIQDRWVLRLGKEDGEFEPWHIGAEDFESDFKAFTEALALTRSMRFIKERAQARKAVLRAAAKAEKEEAKEAEKEAKAIAKEAVKAEKVAAKEAEKAAKAAEKLALKVAKKTLKDFEGTVQ